ncbi:hypothetical protein FACS1894202_14620 [Clostridia bacterium]|nr:hypothetical protein FACS1894202_14620 [Clostridia bacterium]
MNSFIPWIGGKSRLREQIISHFPDNVQRYIEVFGGADWVLFARDRHATHEVFNDIDGQLINLYRCVKHHCGELQRELSHALNSREFFFDAIDQLNTRGMTDTTLANINDADGQWRMLIIKPLREINSNPYIINVKNGLYNVLDNSLMGHTSDYFSTVQLNVSYTPTADCPRFKQFLSEVLNDEDVPLVQEMLGYFLIPINRAQKSFVVVGEPGAGKSKLLLTLNRPLAKLRETC